MEVCRICLGKAEHPHYCSIFSNGSLQKNIPGRLSKLLDITISQDDAGYPSRVCRGCMSRFYSLEKSLEELREKAMNSYREYRRKHSRQSPGTPTSRRPPAKRSSLNRARCLFPEDPSKSLVMTCLTLHAMILIVTRSNPAENSDTTHQKTVQV